MPNSGAARDKAVVAARDWARRAVLGMVRDSGGTVAARPVFHSQPDLEMTVRDAESMAGLRAARCLQLAAEGLARGYIRQAREDGHAWHEIGAALGLAKSAADQETSLSQAAYDHAVGDPPTEYAWSSRQAFTWTCADCRNVISDHGSEADHPEDTESGHGDQCPRLAAATAAWNAWWDAEADQ
jgi:hypothetical protein